MLEITINGKKVQAEDNQTVLDVALKNGIHIPHLCYHPCLSKPANCRLCLVKVNNGPKLMPACNTTVGKDMTIDTECQEVKDARKANMQFLTLDHPVDCGICDKAGECRLQDYHFAYNGEASISNEEKIRKPKFYNINDRIVYDAERCVLCSRCVRFSWEISGSKALGIVEQGAKARVARITESPMNDPYSDNIIDLCPVGALLSKQFMYKSRVWYLEKVPSVCPGCERGCPIDVWRRKKEWNYRSCLNEQNQNVYRITPRASDDAKSPFICNVGRDYFQLLQKKRQLACRVSQKDVSLEKAVSEVKALAKKSKNPVCVLSLWGSNEEFKALKDALGKNWSFLIKDERALFTGEIEKDDLLICANKNPNKATASSLFEIKDAEILNDADLVLVWGKGFDFDRVPKGAAVIYLTAFEDTNVNKANVVLPISTILERQGSFTNVAETTQKFEQVFEKPESVSHAADLFNLLKGI